MSQLALKGFLFARFPMAGITSEPWGFRPLSSERAENALRLGGDKDDKRP